MQQYNTIKEKVDNNDAVYLININLNQNHRPVSAGRSVKYVGMLNLLTLKPQCPAICFSALGNSCSTFLKQGD